MAERGEGEQREAARRRRFWGLIAALAITGIVAGLAIGMVREPVADPGVSIHLAAAAVAAMALLAGLYATYRFFREVDELELLDNLWASTVGFTVFVIGFPVWWALARAGLVGQPDIWTIYGLAAGGGFAAYLWRKWRAR